MNGKTAKLIRRVARLSGASKARLKSACLQQNHIERGVTSTRYKAMLVIAQRKGFQ